MDTTKTTARDLFDDDGDDEPLDLDDVLDMGVVILRCGCVVELDGVCQHGNVSPLIALGLI